MGPQFTTNCFPFLFGLLVWIEARIDIGRLYVAEFWDIRISANMVWSQNMLKAGLSK